MKYADGSSGVQINVFLFAFTMIHMGMGTALSFLFLQSRMSFNFVSFKPHIFETNIF